MTNHDDRGLFCHRMLLRLCCFYSIVVLPGCQHARADDRAPPLKQPPPPPATEPFRFESTLNATRWDSENKLRPVFSRDSRRFILCEPQDAGARVWDAKTLKPITDPLPQKHPLFVGISA